MQISGKSLTFIETEPIKVARSLLYEFFKSLDVKQTTSLISVNVIERDKKYFITLDKKYFNNSKEEIFKEITLEEYNYFLALKTIINYHRKLIEDNGPLDIRDELVKHYWNIND